MCNLHSSLGSDVSFLLTQIATLCNTQKYIESPRLMWKPLFVCCRQVPNWETRPRRFASTVLRQGRWCRPPWPGYAASAVDSSLEEARCAWADSKRAGRGRERRWPPRTGLSCSGGRGCAPEQVWLLGERQCSTLLYYLFPIDSKKKFCNCSGQCHLNIPKLGGQCQLNIPKLGMTAKVLGYFV